MIVCHQLEELADEALHTIDENKGCLQEGPPKARVSKTTMKDDDNWARLTRIWKLSSNHELHRRSQKELRMIENLVEGLTQNKKQPHTRGPNDKIKLN